MMKFLLFFLSTISLVTAFGSFQGKSKATVKGGLPTFDKTTQKWSPAPDAEEPYGIGRTLLGNGPVPTFTRLTNPDDYMQAVYKFQASEKCTTRYAQGNMDAYFENPNDWAYQRSVEDRGGYKKKYGEPIPVKDVVLTVTWGVGVSGLIANFVLNLVSAKQMNEFNNDDIYYRGVLLRTYSRRNVVSKTEYVANAILGFRLSLK
jgi:hypothetical protein